MVVVPSLTLTRGGGRARETGVKVGAHTPGQGLR
jgi:hypothetical protein